MFEKFISQNNCFKLILGANNENYEEITKLVAVYSLAGCKFFDINASKDAVVAAKAGLEISKNEGYICISIGTKDDPHMSKCKININKCTNCKKCINECIQDAIVLNDSYVQINEKKCIGCKKCLKKCRFNAIESYQKEVDFKKTLAEIKDYADCIEYHIISPDKNEIMEKWEYLSSNFPKYLSIALNRSIFSNKDIETILKEMLQIRNNKVLIQADGSAMSGGTDDYNTTLQAISTADIINKMNFNVPIIVSGGTNSKTIKLAKLCNVNINGIAVGSWARKAVKEYVRKENLLKNKEYLNMAVSLAKKVVEPVTETDEKCDLAYE